MVVSVSAVLQKYEERSYDGKRKYYSGSGMVFMGTFYTVNRLHDTKHVRGGAGGGWHTFCAPVGVHPSGAEP